MKKVLAIFMSLVMIMSLVVSVSALKTVQVKSIKIGKSSITLKVGEAYNFKVVFTPADTTQKILKYSTSNKNIAKVDAQGYISAVKAGNAVITATSSSNNKVSTSLKLIIKAQEIITLKVGGPILQGVNGIQNDPVAKEIEKRLGIKIDWSYVGGETRDKTNAMIAAGDLPDIMGVEEVNTVLPKLVKGGLIIPLDNLITDKTPTLKDDPSFKVREWFHKKYVSPDGKLYAINEDCEGNDNPSRPMVANYIRWDVYKQIGKPAIKTTDDFLNVLAQMQKAYPTTKDGKKIYAIGAFFAENLGTGDWQFATIPFAQGYYAAGQGNYITAFDIGTNNIAPTCQITDPKSLYWQTIKWWNKAKQLGILDPDSFTQKYDQYQAKVNEGRYLWTFPSWFIDDANDKLVKAGYKDAAFVLVPPLDGTDKTILKYFSAAGMRPLVISKKCKYPDRAIQLLEFASSTEGTRLINSGVQGDTWDLVNGKPEFKADALSKASDNDFKIKSGVDKYRGLAGFRGTTLLKDGAPGDLTTTVAAKASSIKPSDKEAQAFFGFPNAAFKNKGIKYDTFQDIYLGAKPALPDDLKKANADLSNYAFKEQFKAILADSDSEFDKIKATIIDAVKAFKPEEIYKWNADRMNEAKKDLDPLINNFFKN